ncbi:MAG TPA: DUF2130 domain-containing protein [Candidatus Dormibacteraeota bacterium]|nr:DUF2130 domain-containing protein [Candidatus Dormibacteraeota bacterium]
MNNIICPKCGTKIRVANSLIEPLIQSRVQQSLAATRKEAKTEAQAAVALTIREKELQLAGLRHQIEALQQQAAQGSQQLQGEAHERELEGLLTRTFPLDRIEAIPKGRHGADMVQHVASRPGERAGKLLWECKRTKNWSDTWLAKLREDQRRAQADVAIIVSHALPAELRSFDLVEGIWITHPQFAIPLAVALRHLLIQLSAVRTIGPSSATAGERLYRYITRSDFRRHMERIAEQFATMKTELERERTAVTRTWARREAQIQKAVESTAALYAQLQCTAESEVTGIRAKSAAPLICVPTE